MNDRYIDYPVEEIRARIAAGETQQAIATSLAELDPRITAKLLYKVCKKHGIKCQRTGPRAGAGHPKWNGGRVTARLGYIKVFCPDHPTCLSINAQRAAKANGGYYRKQKYVWEHRLVIEKELGRYLLPTEVVHHKNGRRDDNRLENLVVFQSNAEHLRHELTGKCPKWSEAGKARILASIRGPRAKYRQRISGVPAQPQMKLRSLS